MTTAFASSYLSAVFTDEAIADILSDRFMVRAMLLVEGALADAQGQVGIIPMEAAARISLQTRQLPIEPAVLGGAMIRDGLPVNGLLDILREGLPPEIAGWVHHGSTSQDVMDTALILQIRAVVAVLTKRLDRLIERLAELARAHVDTPLLARTHGQAALPTCFGYKVALWREPLVRQRARLKELEPRLLILQFGGAAGTQAAYGDKAQALGDKLAEILKLDNPTLPWQSQRDTLVEFGSWLAGTAGLIAKIAQDILLLSQSGIEELAEAGAGGSTTMPQKANPMASEALVAIGRHAATQTASLQQSLIAEHERAMGTWQLEWLALPALMQGAGASLALADRLIATLVVRPERMLANLQAQGTFILAERFVFALADHMPRAQAEGLVKAAVVQARQNNQDLSEALKPMTDVALDWDGLSDPLTYCGQAKVLTQRALLQVVQGLKR